MPAIGPGNRAKSCETVLQDGGLFHRQIDRLCPEKLTGVSSKELQKRIMFFHWSSLSVLVCQRPSWIHDCFRLLISFRSLYLKHPSSEVQEMLTTLQEPTVPLKTNAWPTHQSIEDGHCTFRGSGATGWANGDAQSS